MKLVNFILGPKRDRLNRTVLILALSCGFAPSILHARLVDKVVAVVNSQPVTLSDVDKFRHKLETGGLVDDALMKLRDPKTLIHDRQALLEHMVDEKLIDGEVKHKNLDVTIERVEQEIASIAKNNNISRAQLQSALQAKGVTLSQYQDFIKSSLERQSLIEREITSRIRISDEDVNSYYLSQQGPGASQSFEYDLSHIMFSSKNGGADHALMRAKTVEEKLRAGQSFEKVAEDSSDDPAFTKNGALGTFKSGEMRAGLEDAVRSIAAGETTPILKTENGYQIVKVNRRTLIADPKLDEQRESLRHVLYAEAFKRQFRLWLNQRRDEAFVKLNGF